MRKEKKNNLINCLCNLRLIWFAISCIEHCVFVSLFRNISRFNCMASTIVCHNSLNTILIYFGVAAVTFSFLPSFLFFLFRLGLFFSCSPAGCSLVLTWLSYGKLQLITNCGQYLNPHRSVGFCFVVFNAGARSKKSLYLCFSLCKRKYWFLFH